MKNKEILIREAEITDIRAIISIYQHYVRSSIITFDLDPLNEVAYEKIIQEVLKRFPFFVAEKAEEICGYAYLGPWKMRKAYDFTAESSVYLRPGFEGLEIGSCLYEALFKAAKSKSIHTVIAGISLPNEKSVHFHEKFGFKYIGTFIKVGYKFEKWIDVGYWQLTL